MALVVTSLWFDLLWALAVWGQHTWLWLTALLVVATYGLTAMQHHPLFEKMVWMAIVGIVIDSGNMLLGVLTFADGQFPLWLMALWFAFTWYAGHLLPQLTRYSKTLLCIAGGGLGCLSYWFGYRIGAVSWEYPTLLVMLALFLEWIGITWLLLKVMRHEKRTYNPIRFADERFGIRRRR
ncbi:DUF2878 domain-containing protein [Vibrio metoecus]|uniref:DUF2878 domain-containing protein n=1 Tax=Vibrio metoecus TaxID=1481663 RepID=UPI00215B8A6C|nr:DUF2878 domain-containing protein [Vibrio metoecus]MCR9385364.1 DUF2878 domain-containing protein [Vibrio metoecus]